WKFDDESGEPIEAGECRSFPGDESWPSSDVWDTFDEVLGKGALIPTVPLAAPCYESWEVYDEETCSSIQENFSDPYFQSVAPLDRRVVPCSNFRYQRERSYFNRVAYLSR